MNAGEKHAMSAADATLQMRLRLAGVIVLLAGLLAAVVITMTAATDDGGSNADSKRYEYQMDLIGGKSNELATEIREWVGSLWHGRRLAQTLTFFSVVTSLSCFFLAHRLNHSPPPAIRAGGKDA